MTKLTLSFLLCLLMGFPMVGHAQDDSLKTAALEALISAPPERALPIVQRVLASNDDIEIKKRALFVLSQIDLPEAEATLISTAQSSSGELQSEAIRMIGIHGGAEALASLPDIYGQGSEAVRASVLEAYMISGDNQAMYQLALSATEPAEFEKAVQMLGAMGAIEELRALGERVEMSESLAQAFAISGDAESLLKLASDSSNPEAQVAAIRGLGMAGGAQSDEALVAIYRGAQSQEVREAALQGMMMSDNEQAVLTLYRASEDREEKRELLRMLVMMDSDAVWGEIDAVLEDQ